MLTSRTRCSGTSSKPNGVSTQMTYAASMSTSDFDQLPTSELIGAALDEQSRHSEAGEGDLEDVGALLALQRRTTREVFDAAVSLLDDDDPDRRILGARILREHGAPSAGRPTRQIPVQRSAAACPVRSTPTYSPISFLRYRNTAILRISMSSFVYPSMRTALCERPPPVACSMALTMRPTNELLVRSPASPRIRLMTSGTRRCMTLRTGSTLTAMRAS